MGMHADAARCSDPAIESRPDYVEVYIYKGVALAEMGRRAEAAACRVKMKALESNSMS